MCFDGAVGAARGFGGYVVVVAPVSPADAGYVVAVAPVLSVKTDISIFVLLIADKTGLCCL